MIHKQSRPEPGATSKPRERARTYGPSSCANPGARSGESPQHRALETAIIASKKSCLDYVLGFYVDHPPRWTALCSFACAQLYLRN